MTEIFWRIGATLWGTIPYDAGLMALWYAVNLYRVRSLTHAWRLTCHAR